MSEYIVALNDILSRELAQYQQINLLLQKKQRCLVEAKTKDLKLVISEIEEAIVKIKYLEKERTHLFDSFVASKLTRPASDVQSWRKAFPHERASEEELIASFREHDRLKQHLRKVLDEIAGYQESNQLLIMQGQEVLNACIQCLLSQVSAETYDASGKTHKQVEPGHPLIDQRV